MHLNLPIIEEDNGSILDRLFEKLSIVEFPRIGKQNDIYLDHFLFLASGKEIQIHHDFPFLSDVF